MCIGCTVLSCVYTTFTLNPVSWLSTANNFVRTNELAVKSTKSAIIVDQVDHRICAKCLIQN